MSLKHIKFPDPDALPATLYHGATGVYESLMSGYARTGELVKWDQVETNEFLYATASKEEAISLGFASSVEKHWQLSRYQTRNKNIEIWIQAGSPAPSVGQLRETPVYVYTIATSLEHEWVRNKNEFNGLDTEYKTRKKIFADDFKIEKIDVMKWLADKRVSVKINPQHRK